MFITEKQVKWLKWVVGVSYLSVMLVCLLIDETVWKIYFAGNYDKEWFIRDARMNTTT